MNINPRIRLMAGADRSALLMISQYPRSYGRQLLRAQAIKELFHRAILQFALAGCGRQRAERVSKLVAGRLRQLSGINVEATVAERECYFDPIISTLLKMNAALQSQLAAEAVDEVLSSTALASLPPQSHDAPSQRETGIEMDRYKYPDSHYHLSRHQK